MCSGELSFFDKKIKGVVKKNSAQRVEISCFWEISTLFYARSQK